MVDDERWKARFRAARVSLPEWAEQAPHRNLYRSNTTGVWELYTWDRESGTHRQVTDRAEGTVTGAVDPSGEWLWWFDDTDGDEFGVWRRQPFTGGPDEPAVAGLEPSYPSGLCLGASGTAVVGGSTDDGFTVHISGPGRPTRLIYRHEQDGGVAALSRDERLIAIEHSEHGDSRHPALRVLTADGTTVADLWDGPGKGLAAVGFAPLPGDDRLLVLHERRGRSAPLIWHPGSGEEFEPRIELPGEISADWYPDASALLIAHEYQARTRLFRYELAGGALTEIDTPAGSIGSATARPDGTVEYSWSSSARPPAVRASDGRVILTAEGPAAPPSVPAVDAWVDGPGGRVHALISLPAEATAPYPTVFIAHGGPTAHDADQFAPDVAAWVDQGYAVARVNYRGSTGYGSAWRDALEARIGLTELEDIRAVRDWMVASGQADPARIALTGGSWGGFLTLLGLGVHPDAWSAGAAAVPVADYVAAYEDEMEALQAFDRSLFGGSPDEVPDRYRESSPITYIEQVKAPVLVLAGANDPRCPIRQIDNYLKRLAELGKAHEVYRFDAGHGSLVVEERVRQMAAEIAFIRKYLG
ncbi:S9 family peptidase [Allonocardiopsis opalescens]|uniref:Prolyl oligopeptidase family protein n=1 Tax=Allonocardiopsis opalescens TaxID=1144618 RepID=A0A2T0Q6Q3_9ACTN|nr:prolyl oligopeptidase family serine peptidase [Allonocardiopsis opalescens]PRX99498.1 prolyl oligopeptidase family protein [Allonocardiopsis opalescens]